MQPRSLSAFQSVGRNPCSNFLHFEKILSILTEWKHSLLFSGNKETLLDLPKSRGQDPREELLKFHKKFYSSNIMGLSVLGKGLEERVMH